jgi:hypothetical protein
VAYALIVDIVLFVGDLTEIIIIHIIHHIIHHFSIQLLGVMEYIKGNIMQKQKESQIVMQILRYLKAKGIVAAKIKTHGIFDKNKFRKDLWAWCGVPDVLCFDLKKGQMFWLEVKRPKTGRMSDAQLFFQQCCLMCGIKYYEVHSLDEVMAILGDK